MEPKVSNSRDQFDKGGDGQLKPTADELSSNTSVASCPNVTDSSSTASAADDAGDGKSDDEASTLAPPAASASPDLTELFIDGADSRRRPVNISTQCVSYMHQSKHGTTTCIYTWLVAWYSSRTSVFNWGTFPVLRQTCS